MEETRSTRPRRPVSKVLPSPKHAEQQGSAQRVRGNRQLPSSLLERLRRVRLFLCDVDGVLTDGAIWMGRNGETKRFNIRDGLALRILQRNGIAVGWISRRPSEATRERARDLKIDFLIQSDTGKVAGVESILRETGLNWEAVCFVGDDIVDLCVLKRAGLSVAVADAALEPREVAHYVTNAPGGNGAIREMAELILKAQNKWEHILREYEE